MKQKKTVGFIVNPIAGMGGKVGLKGTDGEEILEKAIALGAKPEAPRKASRALEELLPLQDDIQLLTGPGDMGEKVAREVGFDPIVIPAGEPGMRTTAADTIHVAREMAKRNVDLILFAGGDGTARNIYEAVGEAKVPVVGIPAGVKIHSAVYATTPRNAGKVAAMYLQGDIPDVKLHEVMDIDEEAFRQHRVDAKLYGYLPVPHEEELVQGLKAGRAEGEEANVQAIAHGVVDDMDDEHVYIIGPGTTTAAVMEALGLPYSLLGVDVVWKKELIGQDVTEAQLLELIEGRKAKVIVTVIGGQGYVFGRGNQQISAQVLKQVGKDNIIIIAPESKLRALGHKPLLIDTGDEEVNGMLRGYYRVRVGYDNVAVRRVV